MKEIDQFYHKTEEPNKSCFIALRKLILEQDPLLTETIKYGMPCFCYKKKICCYLWKDKKTHWPYILFVEGKLLNEKELEKGNRSKMKTFSVNPSEDLPLETIERLLQCALDLYRSGTIKS